MPLEKIIPFGYCQCGCGQKTPIAKTTRHQLGHVKGEPTPRRAGHNGDRSKRITDKKVKIGRDQCKVIVLTRGKEAIILASDYEAHGKVLWFAHKSQADDFYAARKKNIDGKTVRVFLHREILGLPPGEVSQGDHKNGNTLDCRRRNLRPATKLENSKNRKKYKNNTSGYKGVSWHKRRGMWAACIFINGRNKCLGYFVDPKEAHKAYCVAAKFYYREFARFK